MLGRNKSFFYWLHSVTGSALVWSWGPADPARACALKANLGKRLQWAGVCHLPSSLFSHHPWSCIHNTQVDVYLKRCQSYPLSCNIIPKFISNRIAYVCSKTGRRMVIGQYWQQPTCPLTTEWVNGGIFIQCNTIQQWEWITWINHKHNWSERSHFQKNT